MIESKRRGSASSSPQPKARQGLEFDDAAADSELHHSGETAGLARSETHGAKAKASPKL